MLIATADIGLDAGAVTALELGDISKNGWQQQLERNDRNGTGWSEDTRQECIVLDT